MYIEQLKGANQIHSVFHELKESFFRFSGDLTAYTEKLAAYAEVYACVDDEGNDIGVIAFYANNSQAAFITSILVHSNARHCGVGKKLLLYAEHVCLERGIDMIRLEVHKENQGAIRFYQKMGYDISGDCSECSVYMQKSITESEINYD